MEASASDPGLHRKLVWLNLFRVVTVTVLLGGTAIVSWQTRGEAEQTLAPLYAVVIVTYAFSIAFSVALRLRVALVPVAYGQLALDVAVAAAVVSVTGGIESVFLFMFSLAVVNGAILLYRSGAVAAVALAIPGYLVSIWLFGPRVPAQAPTVFAHGAAFVLTAVLASYLAEQLRTTGERLAALTGLHESIVRSMTGGLATLDPGGRVTFLNPAGEAMAGLALVEVRGRPASAVFPAFEAGTGRGEVAHVNARGERVLLGYSSFPLVGRDDRPLGTAIIFQDLTRLRAMEEAVQRSARLADLGRVAAGLAHELRNPLASISGSVELLCAQAAPDAEDRRLMEIVLSETSRLDRLVTEFLHFARPPPLRRELVDLSGVLGETLEVFSHDPAAAGLSLERDLRPAPADCDPFQVRQVAWNLLLNAAQVPRDHAGGRIRVSCAPLPEGGASFTVEDDGAGISQGDLERIFLPFHSTKERGSGLGLATVHRIVDTHGGQIAVDTALGQGARFTVRLPACPEDGTRAPPLG